MPDLPLPANESLAMLQNNSFFLIFNSKGATLISVEIFKPTWHPKYLTKLPSGIHREYGRGHHCGVEFNVTQNPLIYSN
mgnify:CR=1 FL=1